MLEHSCCRNMPEAKTRFAMALEVPWTMALQLDQFNAAAPQAECCIQAHCHVVRAAALLSSDLPALEEHSTAAWHNKWHMLTVNW